jgi:hypothetical protein
VADKMLYSNSLLSWWIAEVGAEVLDECWERLVLGAIGEVFDAGDEITGVRVIHKVRMQSPCGVHSCGKLHTRTGDGSVSCLNCMADR